jgi:signal recognition particle subunit SEC65
VDGDGFRQKFRSVKNPKKNNIRSTFEHLLLKLDNTKEQQHMITFSNPKSSTKKKTTRTVTTSQHHKNENLMKTRTKKQLG